MKVFLKVRSFKSENLYQWKIYQHMSVSQPMNEWGQWVNEWASEWVSEWVSEEWVSEWVGEWVSEWVSGWVSEWVSESVSQWVNESGSQWASQWVSEWVSQWVSQWVSEPCGKIGGYWKISGSIGENIQKLKMFKIRRIDITLFHCVIWSQLLLACFPKVVSMSTFFNDHITYFAATV